MSQQLERREVPEHLSTPGTAVMEAFDGAPLDPAVWSMYAQIAKTISGTDFVPEGLRGSEAGILACMLYGHDQGIPPMVALREISMIDGKPAMSAELLTAKIRRAGHTLTREELRDGDGVVTGVTAHGQRTDGTTDSFTFTIDMARRAGLLSKRNWQNYPEAMLWARAASQLARMLFGDVFLGLSVYTAEEYGAETDEFGHPLEFRLEAGDDEPGTDARPEAPEPESEAAATPEAAAGVVEDAEPGDDEVDAAAREALHDSFPVPLTRALIEACDTRAELLALAERFNVPHAKRDPIATLTQKLMAVVKAQADAEAEAEPDALTLEPEPEPEPAPADDRDEAEVAEEARRDAFLARLTSALKWVRENYPDSPLDEDQVLSAASKHFDRPIAALDELNADELAEVWTAIPQQARDAIMGGEPS